MTARAGGAAGVPVARARVLELLRHECRISSSDAGALATIVAAAFLFAGFTYPALPQPDGLAGFEVFFALFLIPSLGNRVYREYQWQVWDRMRLVRAPFRLVVVCKALSMTLQAAVTAAVALLATELVFRRSCLSTFAVSLLAVLALSLLIAGATLALNNLVGTVITFSAGAYAVAVAMGGLSGALVPSARIYPHWLQPIMHYSPVRPVVMALRDAVNGGALASVARNLLPEIPWIVVAWILGAALFASAKRRSGWS